MSYLPKTTGGDRVRVTSNDTIADFLKNKLVSGDGSVIFTEINDGGDEDLDLKANPAFLGNGFVPNEILNTETYTIPTRRQATYHGNNFILEGIIDIEGTGEFIMEE